MPHSSSRHQGMVHIAGHTTPVKPSVAKRILTRPEIIWQSGRRCNSNVSPTCRRLEPPCASAAFRGYTAHAAPAADMQRLSRKRKGAPRKRGAKVPPKTVGVGQLGCQLGRPSHSALPASGCTLFVPSCRRGSCLSQWPRPLAPGSPF